VRAQGRLLLFLVAVSVGLTLLQHVTGGGLELVLSVAPMLLVFGIALSGKLPGEKWLLARHAARRPRRRRPPRPHWTRDRERSLASLIERSTQLLRGPPSPAAALHS
jgi:hypothetical protein